MGLRCGAAVYVEGDAELLEALLYHRVVSVHNVLRCDAFLLGAYRDGHSVLVASADEDYVLVLHAQVAHVYVSRNIHSGKVAYVHSAVGIWQSCCYSCTFVVFLFHYHDMFCFLFQKVRKPVSSASVGTCADGWGAVSGMSGVYVGCVLLAYLYAKILKGECNSK